MMFHEILLSDNLSYGAQFGPSFLTTVVKTRSGGEQRVAEWPAALRRGTVGYGVQSRTQMAALLAFYMARQGQLYGFRFSDNSDRDALLEPLVNTGTATLFLQKTYTDGLVTTVRAITKPSLAGPFTLYKDGTVMSTGYALNLTTGAVMLASAAPGSVFAWSGRFDVPVRFDNEWFGAVRDDFDETHWDGIEIVELLL